MKLEELFSVLIIDQPIIICWKGDEDIEIRIMRIEKVPTFLKNEKISRIFVDNDTKINGYPLLVIELMPSSDITEDNPS